jgi:hypothetical protein
VVPSQREGGIVISAGTKGAEQNSRIVSLKMKSKLLDSRPDKKRGQ